MVVVGEEEGAAVAVVVVVLKAFVRHNRIVESPYTIIDSPLGERSGSENGVLDGSIAAST